MGRESAVFVVTGQCREASNSGQRVIDTFKEELIRRLNLPFNGGKDIHEDVSLLRRPGARIRLDALGDPSVRRNQLSHQESDETLAILRLINTVVDYVLEQQDRKGAAREDSPVRVCSRRAVRCFRDRYGIEVVARSQTARGISGRARGGRADGFFPGGAPSSLPEKRASTLDALLAGNVPKIRFGRVASHLPGGRRRTPARRLPGGHNAPSSSSLRKHRADAEFDALLQRAGAAEGAGAKTWPPATPC